VTPARQRTLILGLIIVGILFVGFFGLRFFHAFREFRGHRPPHFPPAGAAPAERDVDLIRDWMTIPYISITYQLPPNLLYRKLDLPPKGNEGKSLKQLNDEYYPQAPGIVMEMVKATIRATQPPPTALIPDTEVPPQTDRPPLTPASPMP
jgi:hypothetical protein